MNAEGGGSSGGAGGGGSGAGAGGSGSGVGGGAGGGSGGNSGASTADPGGSSGGSGGGSLGSNDAPAPGTAPVPGSSAAAKLQAQKNGKYKVKRGGAETEYDVDTLAQLVSDDYEHEIPFANEEKRKFKWPDIVRHVQRSHGADELMRKAGTERKQLTEQVEYGRKNPDWALETILGVKDHKQWAVDIVKKALAEEAELEQLAKSDFGTYNAKMFERAQADLKRRAAFDEQRRQNEEAAAQARKQREHHENNAREGLKGHGVPVNGYTMQLVGQALQKQRELGFQPADPIGHAVAEAAQQYNSELFGIFDGADDERIFALLGPERRKRLRKAEEAYLAGRRGGGGSSAAANDNGDAEDEGGRRRSPVAELSEAKFRKMR